MLRPAQGGFGEVAFMLFAPMFASCFRPKDSITQHNVWTAAARKWPLPFAGKQQRIPRSIQFEENISRLGDIILSESKIPCRTGRPGKKNG
jgi:hypothetical protein